MVNMKKMGSMSEEWKDTRNSCKDYFHKYLPIASWLPKYTFSNLQFDFMAGVTVGVTVIPQAIAYAALAGLPVRYGLYTAFMGSFVYCILGSTKDITLGPSALISLLVAIHGNPSQPEYTVTLTFFVGIILLAMGIFGLGFLVNFISIPVVSAFTSSAAITIAVSQLKAIFGLHGIPREFMPSVIETFKKLKHANCWDILLGISCMIFLIALQRLTKISWMDDVDHKPTFLQRCARKFLWQLGIGRHAVIMLLSIFIAYCFNRNNFSTVSNDVGFALPPFQV